MKKIIIILMMSLFCLINVLGQHGLDVEGVISGDKPMAIVNGEIVMVGDTINECEVIEINDSSITFKYEEETFTVKVWAPEIKKEKKNIAVGTFEAGDDYDYPSSISDLYLEAIFYADMASSFTVRNRGMACELWQEAIIASQNALGSVKGEQRTELLDIIDYARKCIKDFESDKRRAKREGRVIVGMTKSEVRSIMGGPSDINRDQYGEGATEEQWVYGSYGPYLYFDDDYLTAIQGR